MTAGDHKYRIALAAFETIEALYPAIEALLADGIEIARIGLIVSRLLAERIPGSGRHEVDASEPLARIAEGLVPLSDGRSGILASAILVAPWLQGLRAPALWKNDPARGPAPRLATDLEHQVLGGAILLGVGSQTPRDQWHCTRILLEQSSAPVLALECSPPSSTSPEPQPLDD